MQPDARDILAALVAFPSVSSQTNLPLIGWVAARLAAAGFTVARIAAPDPVKGGLIASKGPEGPGGLVLSAHSDVVPVAGQIWTRDPFRLSEEGGRLYGRGVTDMKGFLAAAIAACEAAPAPARPLRLVLSWDEEVGCLGIRDMLPALAALPVPELCIVGEPTALRVATGHKGKAAYQARFFGAGGHSALAPLHLNALHLAADFLSVLRAEQERIVAEDIFTPGDAMPHATLHAGRLTGGSALNMVPAEAEMAFEIRHPARQELEPLIGRLRHEAARIAATDPRARIEIDEVSRYPGLAMAAEEPALQLLLSVTGGAPMQVPYGTEAGFLAGLGWPVLICGPGDMERDGHKPDEGLDAAELEATVAMLSTLIARTCA